LHSSFHWSNCIKRWKQPERKLFKQWRGSFQSNVIEARLASTNLESKNSRSNLQSETSIKFDCGDPQRCRTKIMLTQRPIAPTRLLLSSLLSRHKLKSAPLEIFIYIWTELLTLCINIAVRSLLLFSSWQRWRRKSESWMWRGCRWSEYIKASQQPLFGRGKKPQRSLIGVRNQNWHEKESSVEGPSQRPLETAPSINHMRNILLPVIGVTNLRNNFVKWSFLHNSQSAWPSKQIKSKLAMINWYLLWHSNRMLAVAVLIHHNPLSTSQLSPLPQL
jgi:hypothetical protein